MIVVIPARGGSKRVPRKNVYPLKGRPLLSYTLDALQATSLNLPTYISTDDDFIASIGRNYPGVEVVMRPPEISGDLASTESVLLHILNLLESRQQFPEWVITLPPTSPFRSASTICRFVDSAKQSEADIDCIMSVSPNYGDFWRLRDQGRMERLFPDSPRRQQEREPLYEENSAIYASRTQALRETGLIFGRAVRGIVISTRESFDINNMDDIRLAESLLGELSS